MRIKADLEHGECQRLLDKAMKKSLGIKTKACFDPSVLRVFSHKRFAFARPVALRGWDLNLVTASKKKRQHSSLQL